MYSSIRFYYNVTRIKLFGTKEEKTNIQKLLESYNKMLEGYMEGTGITNKRKASRHMLKGIKKILIEAQALENIKDICK